MAVERIDDVEAGLVTASTTLAEALRELLPAAAPPSLVQQMAEAQARLDGALGDVRAALLLVKEVVKEDVKRRQRPRARAVRLPQRPSASKRKAAHVTVTGSAPPPALGSEIPRPQPRRKPLAFEPAVVEAVEVVAREQRLQDAVARATRRRKTAGAPRLVLIKGGNLG